MDCGHCQREEHKLLLHLRHLIEFPVMSQPFGCAFFCIFTLTENNIVFWRTEKLSTLLFGLVYT